MANEGVQIEFEIKVHAIYFLLIFMNWRNYASKISYSYVTIGIGSYFRITLYIRLVKFKIGKNDFYTAF